MRFDPTEVRDKRQSYYNKKRRAFRCRRADYISEKQQKRLLF